MVCKIALACAGGKGTIKFPTIKVKGLRNKRSKKSPKAILAAIAKKRKRAEEMKNRY
jgi:hypothetical protein